MTTNILAQMDYAGLVGRWHTDPIDQWRRQQKARQHLPPAAPHYTHALADKVTAAVVAILAGLGYTVRPTSHKAPYDLILDDALKIELKAANWTTSGRRGRYKAKLPRRQRKAADLVILATHAGDTWQYFIIPTNAISGAMIEITTPDPAEYAGKYAAYFEAWELLGEALATAPRQLRLEVRQ